jgi:hypothetical protein
MIQNVGFLHFEAVVFLRHCSHWEPCQCLVVLHLLPCTYVVCLWEMQYETYSHVRLKRCSCINEKIFYILSFLVSVVSAMNNIVP